MRKTEPLKTSLYWLVYRLADIHAWILELNNNFEKRLSDKQLHFLVVGAFGMVLFLLLHPVIRFLARKGHTAAITWLIVFILILVITFGIEIGQLVTKTGRMEFEDIVFGVAGFLALFFVFAAPFVVIKMLIDHFRSFYAWNQ